MISIIVAQAQNRVIGNNQDLPWYLPNDLKRFKKLTTGNTVIMGRKTFQSIVDRIGKPLPNRRNIVVSLTLVGSEDGYEVANSYEQALTLAEGDNEIFIIGGASLYKEALATADRLYITQVEAEVNGDTYFPEIDTAIWKTISTEPMSADEKHPFAYTYITMERK